MPTVQGPNRSSRTLNPVPPNHIFGLRGFTSPLLSAVRSQNILEVKKLLQNGSNPDGISLDELSINAADLLRFSPFVSDGTLPGPYLVVFKREDALLAIDIDQLSKITEEEIEDRFEDCVGRFWSEPLLRSQSQIPQGGVIPAIVEAAQGRSVEITDLLLSAGADVSFWLSKPTELPAATTISSLAVTTPLHSAIWSRNLEMLDHFLAKCFNPNIMPLAAATRCITPAMATIVHCDPWNQDAYELLRQHSKYDPNIRTPIYNVHILHFAVAALSLPLLETITTSIALSNAGTTALGHTLLHVACLPLDERYIQLHSKAIYSSIHETRNLSELDGDMKSEHSKRASNNYVVAREIFDEMDINWTFSREPISPAGFRNFLSSSDYHEAQTLVVKLIHRHDVAGLSAQDVHGHIALQYLASQRVVNRDLIFWLRSQKNGDLVWSETKNRCGYTAKELLKPGEAAVEIQEGQPFWHDYDRRQDMNEADQAKLQEKIADMNKRCDSKVFEQSCYEFGVAML